MRRTRNRTSEAPVSFFSFQDVMMCMIGVTIIITLILTLQLGRVAAAVVSDEGAKSERNDQQVLQLTKVRDALVKQLEGLSGLEKVAAEEKLGEHAVELEDLERQLQDVTSKIRVERNLLKRLNESMRGDPEVSEAMALEEKIEKLRGELDKTQRKSLITYLVSPTEPLRPLIAELSSSRIVIFEQGGSGAPISFDVTNPEMAAKWLLDYFHGRPARAELYPLLVVKPSGIPIYEHIRMIMDSDARFVGVDSGADLILESAFIDPTFRSREAGGQ